MPAIAKPYSVHRFEFNEAVLAAVEDAWGLSLGTVFLPVLMETEDCVLLEVRSSTSRKAIVCHDGFCYFLKEIPWYANSDAQLQHSYAVIEAAARQGVPVVRPMVTRSGAPFADIEGHRFTLSPMLSARRYCGGAQERVHVAGAMATLHGCQGAFPDAAGEDYVALVRQFICLASDAMGSDGATLASYLDRRLNSLESAMITNGLSGIAPVPIHGDMNPWNALFGASNEVLALVDFDNCDVGPRIRDIAEMLLTFCALRYEGDTTAFAQPFCPVLDTRAAEVMLASYARFGGGLHQAERDCLDAMFLTVSIEICALGLLRGDFIAARDEASMIHWLETAPSLAASLH